jgi:hypothetical protein
MLQELKLVIPAIRARHGDVAIISCLVQVKDKYMKGFIAETVNSMIMSSADQYLSPKSEVIALLENYVGIWYKDKVSIPLLSDEDIVLFFPVVAGLSSDCIVNILPRIIKLLADDLDQLKQIFSKILNSRPPPLSKVQLLINLHRYLV